MTGLAPITPLEFAGGLLFGGELASLPATTLTPEAALVEAVTPAVQRGPCLISFSGGLDSSLVLAAAARAAKACGAPPPIPITWVADDAPASQEGDWQQAVVAELGLPDWVRLPAGDDLDYVGPVARAVIARHGVWSPPNAHFHAPLLERAAGGTLLTGIGGDQIFGVWRWASAASVRAGTARRTPRTLPGVALSQMPLAVRAARERRRTQLDSPWLRPGVARQLARDVARERAAEPADWPGRIRWQAGRRHLHVGIVALGRIADDAGAQIEHPLLAPSVTAAIATAGGRHGFPRRSAALAALFSGLLPAAVHARRTKATFDEVFAREPSRAAIAAWTGDGIDPALVDPDALAAVWADGVPMRTAMLLQHVATQHPER